MRVQIEFLGRGAKWSLLALQLTCLLNANLVTGVDDSKDIISSESRSPYLYLSQREFQVNPASGQYEEVARYPAETGTAPSPPGTLKKYTENLKKIQQASVETTTVAAYGDEDQSSAPSISSHRFEDAYTKYNFANNDDDAQDRHGSGTPSNIQDVLGHRQGTYSTTPGYSSSETPGQAPSYDSLSYQSPLINYEVPSNYFPGENFEWPSNNQYQSPQAYGPPHGGGGGGFPNPAGLIAPFVSGVGHLTSSVKHVQAQLGEQKAKTAYQIADVVKGTGYAVNDAILNKGHIAGQVIGQTIQTAGDALKNKGHTAQKIIHNKGQLANSAIQSVGNIGSSVLKAKGEFVGAVLKTGAAIGTSALGTASNVLAGGTALVRAKGDATSNLIAGGGRVASGIVGTKGRIISSVINAKGQFVANIVEAKGRGVASILETSGQKLTQLAEAIKTATAQKGGHGGYPGPVGPGWGQWSENQESYSAPPAGGSSDSQPLPKAPTQAELVQAQEEQLPPVNNHQHSHQYVTQSQDYADTYYDPRDTYKRSGSDVAALVNSRRQSTRSTTPGRDQVKSKAVPVTQQNEDDDQEDFQNEYSSYYQPSHYRSNSPSGQQQTLPQEDFTDFQWDQ